LLLARRCRFFIGDSAILRKYSNKLIGVLLVTGLLFASVAYAKEPTVEPQILNATGDVILVSAEDGDGSFWVMQNSLGLLDEHQMCDVADHSAFSA
jgi:hypothetical protein